MKDNNNLLDMELFLKIPKIELHCHIDGCVRPETVMELAAKEKLDLPTYEIEEFRKFLQVDSSCTSLKEYLEKFYYPIALMQKEEYLERIVFELLEDMNNQGVIYAELRCAPQFFMQGGLSFDQVIESILEGMNSASVKYGIRSNLIIACMRHMDCKTSIEIIEQGKKYIGKGIVAIDLAGNEEDFPPEIHKEAFILAKNYGYHITIHAGEVNKPRNIITAVEQLGAERIGHGVNAINEEEVLNFIKLRKIPLEVCITSNIQTQAVEGLMNHPIKKLMDDGVIVTINTDNTTVSNTNLCEEYRKAIKCLEFTLEDLYEVNYNAVDASFETSEGKELLKTELWRRFKNVLRT